MIILKKITYTMITAGILAAGVVGYCLMNKDTKKKADKLLSTVMNDATNKMKMNNTMYK